MSTSPCLGNAVYVCGDQSGVGKTSFCLGFLNACLQRYEPEEIAYIKPCTQCEDIQLLWKWCESVGIKHVGIGPIVYRSGYTYEVIDGQHGTAEERLMTVKRAVDELRMAHKLVIVDGVGYTSVGSCIGVSNADVAAHLDIPVIVVGRPGVGNAIDSCVLCVEFMAARGARVIGAVFNKVPRKVSHHTYDKCVNYVTKFFSNYTYCMIQMKEATEETNVGRPDGSTATTSIAKVVRIRSPVHVYGFVPVMVDKEGNEEQNDGACVLSCSLRKPSKETLEMQEEDVFRSSQLCRYMSKYVNWGSIFEDIDRFEESKSFNK